MNIRLNISFHFIFLLLICYHPSVEACSMYKVSRDGKTMVGCNEDAWRTTSRIWFKNAQGQNEYGAVFTGSRNVHPNLFAPQSGMNEAGLTFSRLASYFPKQPALSTEKNLISNEVAYLTDILHTCASVDDVKKYIEQYDHSIFIDDVFIYIDSSGKYLVVEPYNILEGDDAYYVLSNFCPSITDHAKARKLERYRNGEDFLTTHSLNTSLSFCTALSDTMHVCRNRNGDGTLLTSIWDTKAGLVNIYFYHNYNSTVQFNLSEELAKGDRILQVASLFPQNPEFIRLTEYKTPFNTPFLRVSLVIMGGVLTLIALLFLIVFVRNRKGDNSYHIFMATSALNLLLTGYFFVLATNISIYYFDAPYQHYSSSLISISSYIPFLLLLSILPILFYVIRFFNHERRKSGIKSLIILNNLIYIASIIGFGYWGLFDMLN